ncbi:MAG: hypothetical protein N4A43_02050 [Alphaproteobacteria bacterium]|nr:hypothetical protein [Alphaproteobacteria bacterium]
MPDKLDGFILKELKKSFKKYLDKKDVSVAKSEIKHIGISFRDSKNLGFAFKLLELHPKHVAKVLEFTIAGGAKFNNGRNKGFALDLIDKADLNNVYDKDPIGMSRCLLELMIALTCEGKLSLIDDSNDDVIKCLESYCPPKRFKDLFDKELSSVRNNQESIKREKSLINIFSGLEEAFPDKKVFSNGKNSMLAIGIVNYCANDGNSKVDKKVLGKLTDFFISRGMDLSLDKNNEVLVTIKNSCKKEQRVLVSRLLNDRINKAVKLNDESGDKINQNTLIDKFNKREKLKSSKKEQNKANQPKNS